MLHSHKENTLKPSLQDTICCQTGWTTGWTTGRMFVYTIQPVVRSHCHHYKYMRLRYKGLYHTTIKKTLTNHTPQYKNYFQNSTYYILYQALCAGFCSDQNAWKRLFSSSRDAFSASYTVFLKFTVRGVQLSQLFSKKNNFWTDTVSRWHSYTRLFIISGPLCWNWYSSANKRCFCAKI